MNTYFHHGLGLVLVSFALASCMGSRRLTSPTPETVTVGRGTHLKTTMLFADSLDTMENWTTVVPSSTWKMKEGKLVGHWGEGSTIWCKKNFQGDVLVEFDGEVLTPDAEWVTDDFPEGGKNLNLHFMVTGPEGGDILDGYPELLHEATGPNGAGFDQYQGYFLTWTYHHARLRRSPGYEKVQENLSFLPQLNTPYHFELLRQGNRLRYWINDTLVFDYTDPNPWRRGKMGFTLWRSNVQVDNVTVRRVLDS